MRIKPFYLFLVGFTIAIVFLIQVKKPVPINKKHEEKIEIEEGYSESNIKIINDEPKWVKWPPVRTVNNSRYGKVLSDIESHLPAGHIYDDADLITSSHECSHGIAANIRNRYSRGNVSLEPDLKLKYIGKAPDGTKLWQPSLNVSLARINGFYCLNNKAVIIQEPNVSIQKVAQSVPSSLRGDVYNLYLIQQARSWGDTPLYLGDEWMGYSNGSACRLDLKIKERSETVQYMMEFNVYVICLAKIIKQSDKSYNDKQFKAFLMWNIERSMKIYRGEEGASRYLNKFRHNPDAKNLRTFCKNYFGEDWCKENLKF